MNYGVEGLLTIIDREQDAHRSLESNNGVENVVRDSGNSCKKEEIKEEPTNQTKISIWIVISCISNCLNDIV